MAKCAFPWVSRTNRRVFGKFTGSDDRAEGVGPSSPWAEFDWEAGERPSDRGRPRTKFQSRVGGVRAYDNLTPKAMPAAAQARPDWAGPGVGHAEF